MRVEIDRVLLDLTDDQVDQLRRQLAVPDPVGGAAFLDAAEVARRLGLSREYVYEHARELGGEKIGSGPKSPWRFRWTAVEGAIARNNGTDIGAGTSTVSRPRRRRSRPRTGSGEGLLVAKGNGPYSPRHNKTTSGGASTPTGGLTKGGVISDG